MYDNDNGNGIRMYCVYVYFLCQYVMLYVFKLYFKAFNVETGNIYKYLHCCLRKKEHDTFVVNTLNQPHQCKKNNQMLRIALCTA